MPSVTSVWNVWNVPSTTAGPPSPTPGRWGAGCVRQILNVAVLMTSGSPQDEFPTSNAQRPTTPNSQLPTPNNVQLGSWALEVVGRRELEIGRSRFLLLDDLLQIVGHGWKRNARQLQFAFAPPPHHDVDGTKLGDLVGIVLAEVAAAAFLPLDRRSRDGF